MLRFGHDPVALRLGAPGRPIPHHEPPGDESVSRQACLLRRHRHEGQRALRAHDSMALASHRKHSQRRSRASYRSVTCPPPQADAAEFSSRLEPSISPTACLSTARLATPRRRRELSGAQGQQPADAEPLYRASRAGVDRAHSLPSGLLPLNKSSGQLQPRAEADRQHGAPPAGAGRHGVALVPRLRRQTRRARHGGHRAPRPK